MTALSYLASTSFPCPCFASTPPQSFRASPSCGPVSYTHLDVYKRQQNDLWQTNRMRPRVELPRRPVSTRGLGRMQPRHQQNPEECVHARFRALLGYRLDPVPALQRAPLTQWPARAGLWRRLFWVQTTGVGVHSPESRRPQRSLGQARRIGRALPRPPDSSLKCCPSRTAVGRAGLSLIHI